MKLIETVLVPTDLTDRSRRAVEFAASLAVENNGRLLIMHVANEFAAWEFYEDSFGFPQHWPLDRVFEEAALDLTRFLEPHSDALSRVPRLFKRLDLGCIPEQIVAVANEAKADLIVLSPRRERGWRSLFGVGTTETVRRLSPCAVLSVAPPLPSTPWRGKRMPTPFGWSRPQVETV
jgi:nucleotide-binding universal stress UspA family protein